MNNEYLVPENIKNLVENVSAKWKTKHDKLTAIQRLEAIKQYIETNLQNIKI